MKFKLWISLLVILGLILIPIQFVDAIAFIQGTVSYFDDLLDVNVPSPEDRQILVWDSGTANWTNATQYGGIIFIIDGAGSAITTGEKGHLEIPFNCTITQATMLANQTGSIVIDVWKDTYANFPPTNADNITGTTPPTITTAQKSQDNTLTNWTINITAGEILAYNVDSCTNITRITLALQVTRT